MKVPVDRRRTILIFIIADLLFAVALFLSCMQLFLFQRWGVIQILIIILYVGTSIGMLLLALLRNFYVIESKFLVQVRAFKEAYFYYNDVVYVDKEQAEKKRTLAFYTNKGQVKYLPFDRNGEIYKVMLKRCNNLIDKEEFKKRHPNVKI